MKLYRGYRFRIYPNKKQEEMINLIISNCNFVYNYFIDEQKKAYQESKKYLTVSECIKKLPALKKEFPHLKNGESTSLQQTLRHLDRAYKNFFKKQAQYPHYKNSLIGGSYTCTRNGSSPANIRIEDNKLVLPKLGRVKVKWHRTLPENSNITSATIRKNYSGNYEISIHVTKEQEVIKQDDSTAVGIVYNPDHFFIASDGTYGESIPESYLKVQNKIERCKNNLKRKKEGSENWKKEKLKLKKANEKAKNIKRDYLHKMSKDIVEKYNVIVVKEFNSELFNMKASRKEGWNQFLTFLKYKVEEKGGKFILVTEKELPAPSPTERLCYEKGLEQAKKLEAFGVSKNNS